jgi:hypothetical protein
MQSDPLSRFQAIIFKRDIDVCQSMSELVELRVCLSRWWQAASEPFKYCNCMTAYRQENWIMQF